MVVVIWAEESRVSRMIRNWLKDPIPVATVIIMIATVVNVIVAKYQWQAMTNSVSVSKESVEISRKVFEAANRPYVAVEDIEVQRNEDAKNLRIRTTFKNFGSIPAYETILLGDVYLGNEVQEFKNLSKPLTLMPGSSISVASDLSSEWTAQVMTKRKDLLITATVFYRDTVRPHTHCQNFVVRGDLSIISMGDCAQPAETKEQYKEQYKRLK